MLYYRVDRDQIKLRCSCQQGPSLQSGILHRVHPNRVLGGRRRLTHSLLSRAFCVVFTESSIRGFLSSSSFVDPLPAATQAAQLGFLGNSWTGPCPWSFAGALCISFASIVATRLGGLVRHSPLLNKASTSSSRKALWALRFGQWPGIDLLESL